MNLGILLSPGDSLTKQKKSGQLDRLIDYYLKPYSQNFKKVYLFSYGDSRFKPQLPANINLIPKPKQIPYQAYQFILPLLHRKIIKQINIFRLFQATGGLPILFINKPSIVTYGYHYHQFAKVEHQPLKAKLIALLIKPILKKAQKIIVTTSENLDYFKNTDFQSKTILIPNGVDPQKFKPGGQRDKMTILSVGRLTYQKNHSLLIKAVSRSKFKLKIKLKIIGQGILKNQLKQLAHRLKVNLTIYQPVSHPQLAEHYQQAAVFALTSKIEGQPKVLLEAMSSGCACLTTPFAGNLINHGKTGLIGSSIKSLANQLDQLLSSQNQCHRLGQAARRLVERDFNLEKLVNQEIKLLYSNSL